MMLPLFGALAVATTLGFFVDYGLSLSYWMGRKLTNVFDDIEDCQPVHLDVIIPR